MKTKTNVLTLLLCLFSVSWCVAQRENTWKGVNYVASKASQFHQFPDSIRVEFPDQKAIVVFEIKNITKHQDFADKFPEELKKWLQDIAAASSETTTPQQVTVHRNSAGDNVITMKASLEKTTRIISSSSGITELIPPGWEIFFTSADRKIYVYAPAFKDLEALAAQNFENVKQKIKEEITAHQMMRKSLLTRFVQQDNKITYSSLRHRNVNDFMDLGGAGGFGFLSDKFYPALDLQLSFRFSDRFNRRSQRLTITYNNMFFSEKRADGSYQSNINSFITAGWTTNLQEAGKTPVWSGLGAGYLIHREGDYFHGKTMKFYSTTTIGRFVLSPEVYLTNGVKNFSFGLKTAFVF